MNPTEFKSKTMNKLLRESIFQLNPNTPLEDCPDCQSEKSSDNESKEFNLEQIDIAKLLVFSELSTFSIYWNSVDIFSCVVSSYFYAYLGCFGHDAINPAVEGLILLFELIFVLSLIKNFITDYTPDGE